jgi:poly [ADP-ribose] polymerase 1
VQKHGSLVSDASLLKGLDMLRWDDQQDLRKRGGFSTTGAPVAAEREEPSSDSEEVSLKTEYAKSNQSTCRGCSSKIMKGEVRIGKEVQEGPYTSVQWHHLACYKVPSSLTDATLIDGYSKMKADDKNAIKDHIDAAHKAKASKSKKRKAAEPADAPDPKRAKIEAEMKARADKLWKVVDKLKGKYSNDELKAILKYNDQSDYGGPQELLFRVAEGEMAGALPRCSECESGHLSYEHGKIKCYGHLSAYSKCTFETTELDSIKRGKWKYPKVSDLPDLVADLKAEKKEKKMAEAAPAPVVAKSTVFDKCVFTIIGSVDDKADVEYKIENFSGELVGSVTKKCTHIISTYQEVSKAKKTAKLTNALKSGLPVVGAHSHFSISTFLLVSDFGCLDPVFLDHALNKDSLDDIEKFLVWKDGKPRQVEDAVRDAVVPFSGIPKKKRMAIPPVDPQSELAETGSILVDDDEVFGVMLNMTDLSVGQSGLNSFYVLQIIKHNTKASKFNVFRRWGRVGSDGDSKEETFKSKDAAIEDFKTVFFDKTKNHWETYVHGQFEKKPSKFAPVELDGGDSDDESDLENLKKKVVVAAPSDKKFVLDDRVQKLVKLLFDTGSSISLSCRMVLVPLL